MRTEARRVYDREIIVLVFWPALVHPISAFNVSASHFSFVSVDEVIVFAYESHN